MSMRHGSDAADGHEATTTIGVGNAPGGTRRAPATGLLAAALTVLAAAPAGASEEDEPDSADVALRASEVHAENCPEIYSRQVTLIAEGYRQVSSVWEDLYDEYDATGEPSLLYWRGMLALCLGQEDLGRDDLQGFIDALDEEQRDTLSDLVRRAESRLRRLEQAERQRGRSVDPFRRFTVFMSAGPSYGPLSVRAAVADIPQDGYTRTAWVQGSWQMGWSVGVEFRVWRPFYLLISFDLYSGDHEAGRWSYSGDTISFSDPDSRDELVPMQVSTWTGFRIGASIAFLPHKPVSPVLRPSALFRSYPAWAIEGYDAEVPRYDLGATGGYVGLLIDSRKTVGLDVGCWIAMDTSATNFRNNGANGIADVEYDPQDFSDTVVGKTTRLLVQPRASFRASF